MEKRKSWLGILAVVLVFGVMIIGCKDEEYPAELKVTNSTSVGITLVEFRDSGIVIKSDNVTIPAGQSKNYELNSDFYGSIKIVLSPLGIPVVECIISNVTLYPGYEKSGKSGGKLKPSKKELLVSGNVLSGFELSIIDL